MYGLCHLKAFHWMYMKLQYRYEIMQWMEIWRVLIGHVTWKINGGFSKEKLTIVTIDNGERRTEN